LRWRATPPAIPARSPGKAARPRTGTNGCTSRSSARRAADVVAWATERSSRKTAFTQPSSLHPDRPLAPSEGSNEWIERPKPRRRRRLRTGSPRSSSDRPTPRVNQPPVPPSAHRRSRVSGSPTSAPAGVRFGRGHPKEKGHPKGNEDPRGRRRRPPRGQTRTGTNGGRGRATATRRNRRRAAGEAVEAAAGEVEAVGAAGPGRAPRPPPDRPTRRSTPSNGAAKVDARGAAEAAPRPRNASRHPQVSARTPSPTKPLHR
jgi:hypothetical protein